MKRFLLRSLLTVAAFSIVSSSFAFSTVSLVVPVEKTATTTWTSQFNGAPEAKTLTPEMVKMGMNEFLRLTPSKYKKLTGHSLGLKKSLELKAAQKMLKKNMEGEKVSKGLYIVLAILGLGFLGIGLLTDWQGNDWWICLILSLLCWLPGLIYALVKMKNYYK